jgi:superfamily II DNA or RNA helicase
MGPGGRASGSIQAGCIVAGSVVRLIHDPAAIGGVERIISIGDRPYAVVRFPGAQRRIPVEQLELVPFSGEGPLDLLAAGRLTDPSRLRQVLAHVRLTGRLADMIYSMEATNTDFHAHQFKPVLKLLGSPGGGLLIADEVGLGKTIEAGLIWTELRARYDARRLLVVCPKVLTRKWQAELGTKFGVDAPILNAADLLALLSDQARVQRGFTAICGVQGIRPPRGWDDDEPPPASASAKLARLLEERAAGDPLIDLLVIDEAHHLRNLETQSHRLGELLRPVSEHRVFLSATPIHLQDRDLFALLRLLDPDSFAAQWQFQAVMEANRPLVRARDLVLRRGTTIQQLREELARAAAEPLLAESRQLRSLIDELDADSDPIAPARRAAIAGRLDHVNLLANIVTRTRRRDVEELRVVRDVEVARVEFHPIEREVYEAISLEVSAYARNLDANERFLMATPQRLLSSCLAAAVEHWRARLTDPGDEDDETLPDDAEGLDQQPLVARIALRCRALPNAAELEAVDSKFDRLIAVLRGYLASAPGEKVVVFSTFKPTLNYLARRLARSGIACELMHGDIKEDRSDLIARFASQDGAPVLLSSEIGSEGIDLQFSRVVINYDLPWNPMRVEQRIGRIDRLGQKSDKVSVLNFVHVRTIDERIYDRLYVRLDLCKSALGGFEEILGAQIRELTAALLTGELSEQQQAERIDQTALAFEQRRSIETQLEEEAASLLAHGDFILKSVRQARDLNRWISASDLISYIRDTLNLLHPGCGVRELEEERCEITLTGDAQDDYANWAEKRSLPDAGRLARDSGPVLLQLGRQAGGRRRGSRAERMAQTHPFVRFLAGRLEESEAPRLRPAAAAIVPLNALTREIPPGRYVLMVQRWMFGGETTEERLGYAAWAVGENRLIGDEEAEALAIAAASAGRYWADAAQATDTRAVGDVAEANLIPVLTARFEAFVEAKRVEQEDRVAVQRRAIEAGRERELQKLQAQLDEHQRKQRSRLIAPTKGRMDAVERRFRRRLEKIEATLKMTEAAEDLAVALVEVVP